MILRYLLFSLLIFRHKSTDNLAKTLAISSKLIEISYFPKEHLRDLSKTASE